ncbi:MAG: hypothetical protein FD149_865 [Rhodospirillaceae bacterium]|nr:MAG: hypothetical protein FD149_865 [Rhodospirillaceae bacterium]
MDSRTMDVALGGGAITLPLWVQTLSDWMQILAIVLGTALVGIRLALAVHECRGRCWPGDKHKGGR